MTTVPETRAEKWTRRAGDAAIEAVCEGASPEQVRAAVEAGINEAYRILAVRRGEAPPSGPSAPAPPPVTPGSAVDALLRTNR